VDRVRSDSLQGCEGRLGTDIKVECLRVKV
jgi:hypothetical protein